MSFTADEINEAREYVNESKAISVYRYPSQFGIISGQNEMLRVFKVPTSSNMALYTAVLDEYGSLPRDFDTAPTSGALVIDPYLDGEVKEGRYRHAYTRIYTLNDESTGTPHYYIIQVLRKGFVESISFAFEMTSADASITLNGVRFYDYGSLNNSESVYYGENEVYAYWNHATLGWLISAKEDVGGTPTDYFAVQSYPDTIIASGGGDSSVNTSYAIESITSGIPKYESTVGSVIVAAELSVGIVDSWRIFGTGGGAYSITSSETVPPKTGYSVGAGNPAPTLAYTTPAANVLRGKGTWSGTITLSDIVIVDAWSRAETAVFDSLKSFAGYEENKNCYRGFLPIHGDGDDMLQYNVWMLTSGGSGEFDTDRLSADNPLWCSLRSDARIDSIWKDRSDAMKWGGVVMAWLKQVENLRETGNIEQVRMTDIPAEPEEYLIGDRQRERYWKQTVDLEIIYKTETEYA